MLLKQMAESEDRGLVRDPIADQLNAGKAKHSGNLNQGLFHGRIAERITLLLKIDAQNPCQRIERAAAFLAPLGVVRLDVNVDPSPQRIMGFGIDNREKAGKYLELLASLIFQNKNGNRVKLPCRSASLKISNDRRCNSSQPDRDALAAWEASVMIQLV